ncbi:hypothetical protein BJ742DRAFT_801093 [Cladochytrium replicatum]|nr:hypothetical protein BJ742DRAFT_801093 [Cladochytrium replicatum]
MWLIVSCFGFIMIASPTSSQPPAAAVPLPYNQTIVSAIVEASKKSISASSSEKHQLDSSIDVWHSHIKNLEKSANISGVHARKYFEAVIACVEAVSHIVSTVQECLNSSIWDCACAIVSTAARLAHEGVKQFGREVSEISQALQKKVSALNDVMFDNLSTFRPKNDAVTAFSHCLDGLISQARFARSMNILPLVSATWKSVIGIANNLLESENSLVPKVIESITSNFAEHFGTAFRANPKNTKSLLTLAKFYLSKLNAIVRLHPKTACNEVYCKDVCSVLSLAIFASTLTQTSSSPHVVDTDQELMKGVHSTVNLIVSTTKVDYRRKHIILSMLARFPLSIQPQSHLATLRMVAIILRYVDNPFPFAELFETVRNCSPTELVRSRVYRETVVAMAVYGRAVPQGLKDFESACLKAVLEGCAVEWMLGADGLTCFWTIARIQNGAVESRIKLLQQLCLRARPCSTLHLRLSRLCRIAISIVRGSTDQYEDTCRNLSPHYDDDSLQQALEMCSIKSAAGIETLDILTKICNTIGNELEQDGQNDPVLILRLFFALELPLRCLALVANDPSIPGPDDFMKQTAQSGKETCIDFITRFIPLLYSGAPEALNVANSCNDPTLLMTTSMTAGTLLRVATSWLQYLSVDHIASMLDTTIGWINGGYSAGHYLPWAELVAFLDGLISGSAVSQHIAERVTTLLNAMLSFPENHWSITHQALSIAAGQSAELSGDPSKSPFAQNSIIGPITAGYLGESRTRNPLLDSVIPSRVDRMTMKLGKLLTPELGGTDVLQSAHTLIDFLETSSPPPTKQIEGALRKLKFQLDKHFHQR